MIITKQAKKCKSTIEFFKKKNFVHHNCFTWNHYFSFIKYQSGCLCECQKSWGRSTVSRLRGGGPAWGDPPPSLWRHLLLQLSGILPSGKSEDKSARSAL